MFDFFIRSSSRIPKPTSKKLKPCGIDTVIPTCDNPYARAQQQNTVEVAADATIPFNILVSDFTDNDFTTSDFEKVNCRKGVYFISVTATLSSVAGGQPRLGIELVNSREPSPTVWSATATSGDSISVNTSYIVEFLEDETVEVVNRTPASVNVTDFDLNLIKLKNYGGGASSVTS